jgi:hypothetical protein
MEPRKPLREEMIEYEPSMKERPEEYFRKARIFAEKFYQEDIDRIWGTKFKEVQPNFFFMEYVFVVHATGFNAGVVTKMLPRLLSAYGLRDDGSGWDALADRPETDMLASVLPVCNNPQKAKAVRKTALLMKEAMFPDDPGSPAETWEEFKRGRLSSAEKMVKLPYVGRITCHHLARNLGLLDSVKPDLHLVRMAEHWGFKDCVAMCEAVRPEGMPLGIVDLILWYASSTFGTVGVRKPGER